MIKDKRNKYASLSEGVSERDVFQRPLQDPDAGDLFTKPFNPEDSLEGLSGMALPDEVGLVRPRRLSSSQTLLVAGIVFIVAMLSYVVFRVPHPVSTQAQPEPDYGATSPTDNTDAPVAQTHPTTQASIPAHLAPAQRTEFSSEAGPLSLAIAEELYAQQDFESAYMAYFRLHEQVASVPDDKAMADFMILRMALCAKGLGQKEQELQLLNTAGQSEIPLVRALARYHQGLEALHVGQSLNAVSRAYQALSLSDVLAYESKWLRRFSLNCQFLICQAASRQALALSDLDDEYPEMLWTFEDLPDPFLGRDDQDLRRLLASGRDLYGKAVLGPRVQRADTEQRPHVWQVVCNGASIDELLIRFAANADMDLSWAFDSEQGQEQIPLSIRKRPIHLFLVNKAAHEVVQQAAGCAQLFSEIDAQGTVHLMNPDPAACKSLSMCTEAWTLQGMDLWQQLIWASEKSYVPTAHYALALMKESRKRPTEAIAEYRLLADRFQHSELAPYALFRSSKLKTQLHDYIGAREDLKLLVDQYPDVDFSGEACLYLADASHKAGLFQEAFRLYNKVFNTALASAGRRAAALGAGNSCFEQGHFEDAARWFARYLDLTVRSTDENPYQARLLLGKTLRLLEKPDQACQLFQQVMTRDADPAAYFEALQGYALTQIAQGEFVDALNRLEGEHPWPLSRRQNSQRVVLIAKSLRIMGIPRKGLGLLDRQLQLIPDRDQRAEVYFEMGLAAQDLEDYQSARRYFSEVLVLAEPGPILSEAGYGLAQVCLQLGQVAKSLRICQQVMKDDPEGDLRKKILRLQTQAYLKQGQYNQAAQALLQQTTGLDAQVPVSESESGEEAASLLPDTVKEGQS